MNITYNRPKRSLEPLAYYRVVREGDEFELYTDDQEISEEDRLTICSQFVNNQSQIVDKYKNGLDLIMSKDYNLPFPKPIDYDSTPFLWCEFNKILGVDAFDCRDKLDEYKSFVKRHELRKMQIGILLYRYPEMLK